MSWEAYRWTAKAPSELYHTFGPQGVERLIQQMIDACWRESPEEGRSVAAVKQRVQEVFDRNTAVWSRIKQPSPAAFFENLLPYPADGFCRQAMVLCWMMMPRAGGRNVADVRKIVGQIYQRNLDAWADDEQTFNPTKPAPAKRKGARKPPAKPPRRAKAAKGRKK